MTAKKVLPNPHEDRLRRLQRAAIELLDAALDQVHLSGVSMGWKPTLDRFPSCITANLKIDCCPERRDVQFHFAGGGEFTVTVEPYLCTRIARAAGVPPGPRTA